MHLQVKTIIPGAGFPEDLHSKESATYGRGRFEELLGFLADGGFNIRGASGHRIEFGGEFTFWCGERGSSDDDANHAATEAAAELLRSKGYDARVVEVSSDWLTDTDGALRAFVRRLTDDGLWIEEITIGTPDGTGLIPVQIYCSRA